MFFSNFDLIWFWLYVQAKTDNNPFHLELDEADSEATTKKVKIAYPA